MKDTEVSCGDIFNYTAGEKVYKIMIMEAPPGAITLKASVLCGEFIPISNLEMTRLTLSKNDLAENAEKLS